MRNGVSYNIKSKKFVKLFFDLVECLFNNYGSIKIVWSHYYRVWKEMDVRSAGREISGRLS